jgi:hypothetical protein
MTSKSKESSRASIVVGIILSLFGIWILSNTCHDLYLSQVAKSWPTADGRIVHSAIKGSGGMRKKSRKYTPVIRYEYEVNGHRLTNDRLAFGLARGTKSWAEQKVKEYPKGQAVKVRHDPLKHGTAALETSTVFNPLGVLASPFMALSGFALLRYGTRARRQETRQHTADPRR